MWIVYALAASIIWGISYAASGRVIERGMTPLVFLSVYSFRRGGCRGGASYYGQDGTTIFRVPRRGGGLGLACGRGRVFGRRCASYLHRHRGKECHARFVDRNLLPVFRGGIRVAFFRETQFSWPTILGGVLILGGVGVVFLEGKALNIPPPDDGFDHESVIRRALLADRTTCVNCAIRGSNEVFFSCQRRTAK